MKHYGKNVVIVLALLGAGFFAAWLRFRPYLGSEDLYTDGERTYATATSEEIRYAVWDIPQRLSGQVNTPALEGRPAVSPDGRYLVFSVGDAGLNSDLYIAELIDGEPDRPAPLVVLNSDYDESAPAFSNGYLYFASNRAGGAGGLDLYRARYSDGVVADPEPVGPGINTEADETDPAPVPDSPDIAFASDRKGGPVIDFDLYFAVAPGFGAPEDAVWEVSAMHAVNSLFHEREPAFAADGRTLLFASDRATAVGGYDLFRSILDRGEWLTPEAVPGVNSDQDERGPHAASDGFALWFSAEVEPGDFDLFRARSLELFRIPGRPVGFIDLLVLMSLLVLALLAFLAKRWERMDIVYKCFLVSVVIHLMLLWWFQRVVPEPGEGAAPSSRNALFTVSLAVDRSTQQAARQERSGQLESQRREAVEEAASPERKQAERPKDQALTAAPEKALARAEAQLTRGPERLQTEVSRAAKAMDPSHAQQQVETAQPTEQVQRIQGQVPTLSVAAQSSQQGERELRQGDPNRTSVVMNRNSAAAPTSAPVALASQAPVWVPQAAPSEAAPSREAPVSDAAVEMAQPTEQIVRKDGVVADLQLAAADIALPDAQFSESLDRATHGAPQATAEQAPPRLDTASAIEFQPDAALALDDSWMPARDTNRLEPTLRDSGVDVSLEDDEEIPLPNPETLVMAEPEVVTGPSVEFDRPDAQATDGEVTPTRFTRDRTSLEAPELRPLKRPEIAKADHSSRLPEPKPLRKTPTEISREPRFKEPSVALKDKPDPSELPSNRELQEETPALAMDLTAQRSKPTRRPVPNPGAPTRQRFEADKRPQPVKPKLRTFDPEAMDQEPLKELTETPSRLVHTPYRSRFGTEKQVALQKFGGSTETEAAVEKGLEYLANIQGPGGHWGSSDDFHEKYGHVSVGKTGLCTLAFLGAGHTHQSNTQHSGVVRKALTFLLESQDPGSGHFGYSSAYSHGVATYALAETYALTKDKELELPLRRAIDHILQQQYGGLDRRRTGGWGYYNASGDHYDNWPRASVTSWQVMALKSARIGGLEVPDEAFERAHSFLMNTYDERQRWFRYNHSPERLNSGYPTLPGSTPAAMFALSLLGEDLADQRWHGARGFILNRAPRRYRFTNDDDFVLKASGNLYFWYYATLAMFRAQGKDWEFWNERMKKTLLPAQAANGSWQPISVYARYAGDDNKDRSYTTAMCVLTLEVYYRYFTPLLQEN